MPLFVVAIALPIPLRKEFDYLPMSAHEKRSSYKPGLRCQVSFGKKVMVGIIIKCHNQPSVDYQKLKPINSLLDDQPYITKNALDLYHWISSYYHCSLGEVLFTAIPPTLRKPKTQDSLLSTTHTLYWRLTDKAPAKARGKRQSMVIEHLRDNHQEVKESALINLGISKALLKSLEEKDWISSDFKYEQLSPPSPKLKPLTDFQQIAYLELLESAGNFNVTLLHGVTGSGKTEIYIHWIKHILTSDSSAQVLIMVPEISLTPQTIDRFKSCFGDIVASYHSGLGDSDRLRTWSQVQNGAIKVVVGTRSSILLPFYALKGIVIDEEHDSSLKQQEAPRYHARDVAILRAQRSGCPIVLGSATPSFESLHNAASKKYKLITLNKRHQAFPLPKVYSLDISNKHLDGGIAPQAINLIKTKLGRGEQVMVFVNRRGFAPVVMCNSCGWMAECSNCDVRLTYHLKGNILKCHHCDKHYPLPETCPNCGACQLTPVGTGTERTEQILESFFPEADIIRVDRDSTQGKSQLDQKLSQIRTGKPCLIVGTQMLAKGHNFPALNTVVIINADGGLFSSDFRATEKTAQLLIQVAGRAGRNSQNGEVYIQTQFPDHPIIQSIKEHDYHRIYDTEIELRRQAQLPPVSHLTLIKADAPSMQRGLSLLEQFKSELNQFHNGTVKISGPMPSIIQRKQNRFHTMMWLASAHRPHLRKTIHDWLNWREKEKPKSDSMVRWALDVDPLETL